MTRRDRDREHEHDRTNEHLRSWEKIRRREQQRRRKERRRRMERWRRQGRLGWAREPRLERGQLRWERERWRGEPWEPSTKPWREPLMNERTSENHCLGFWVFEKDSVWVCLCVWRWEKGIVVASVYIGREVMGSSAVYRLAILLSCDSWFPLWAPTTLISNDSLPLLFLCAWSWT